MESVDSVHIEWRSMRHVLKHFFIRFIVIPSHLSFKSLPHRHVMYNARYFRNALLIKQNVQSVSLLSI